ncbi:MAG: VanZ family protein, partial [Chloroflexi bacterium]|nr:VanZ family protein [Chloroflexota bacterium]
MVVEKRTWGGTVVRWLPPLVWMGIIFFVSGQAKTDVPSFGGWDLLVKKGGHFLAYALLAWLLLRAMGEAERPYLYAFIITVLYAVSDEFHQTFVPGRGGRL